MLRSYKTYRSSKTKVVTQKGETEYFAIELGLNQGSALSPLLFIIIVDVLDTRYKIQETLFNVGLYTETLAQ